MFKTKRGDVRITCLGTLNIAKRMIEVLENDMADELQWLWVGGYYRTNKKLPQLGRVWVNGYYKGIGIKES